MAYRSYAPRFRTTRRPSSYSGPNLAPVTGYSLGAVELPRATVDTTYSLPSGNIYTLSDTGVMGDSSASDFSSLQNAFNAISGNDVLVIRNGSVFTGQFSLPATSGGWIYVIPEDIGFLPSVGNRTKPTRDGPNEYYTIQTNLGGSAAAIRTLANGVNRWRFIGAKFTLLEAAFSDGSYVNALIRFDPTSPSVVADLPSYMIFDRCWFYGQNNTASKSVGVQHGLSGHGQHIAMVQCWSEKIGAPGYESQCFNALMGDGPTLIYDNHLEATTENTLFGGATGVPFGTAIMQDVTFRGNHVYKPENWNENDGANYDGINRSCKNLFEVKFAKRLLVENNVFEGSWPPDQDGFAISIKVGGENSNGVTQDVTVRYNDCSRCAGGINVSTDLYPTYPTRIAVYQNLFKVEAGADFGSKGRAQQLFAGAGESWYRNNTFVGLTTNVYSAIAFANRVVENWDFRNNLFTQMGLGIKGDSQLEGTNTINAYTTNPYCQGNIFTGRSSSLYPSGNYFPVDDTAIGLVDEAGGDYHLDAASLYKGGGTDGEDPGVDIDALEAAISGVVI